MKHIKPKCKECEHYETYAIAAGVKLYRCMLIDKCSIEDDDL